MRAVLISGSPSATSKSRALLERARERLRDAGWDTVLIDLSTLPADALLGRGASDGVTRALTAVQQARLVIAASPVYRATYSGLLKVFFDLLPQDGLAGKIAVPMLTGGSPAHLLALDHGFRPLFTSVGATVVAAGVYGSDAQFKNGPDATLLASVDQAIDAALTLSNHT